MENFARLASKENQSAPISSALRATEIIEELVQRTSVFENILATPRASRQLEIACRIGCSVTRSRSRRSCPRGVERPRIHLACPGTLVADDITEVDVLGFDHSAAIEIAAGGERRISAGAVDTDGRPVCIGLSFGWCSEVQHVHNLLESIAHGVHKSCGEPAAQPSTAIGRWHRPCSVPDR